MFKITSQMKRHKRLFAKGVYNTHLTEIALDLELEDLNLSSKLYCSLTLPVDQSLRGQTSLSQGPIHCHPPCEYRKELRNMLALFKMLGKCTVIFLNCSRTQSSVAVGLISVI